MGRRKDRDKEEKEKENETVQDGWTRLRKEKIPTEDFKIWEVRDQNATEGWKTGECFLERVVMDFGVRKSIRKRKARI